MSQAIMLLILLLATDVWASSISKLMTAVQKGNTDIVAQIIKQIPIDSRDARARTAVHYAVVHVQPAVLELLIANGADPNIFDADGNTPYDLYIQQVTGKAPDGLYIKHKDDSIRRILRDATALTGKKVEKALDEEEASSVAGKALHNRHADMLFKAAEDGDREAIELLLQAGADPKTKNSAGEFPFHIAARNRHLSVAAILLKAIGDVSGNGVNQKDNKSWRPIHWAILAKDWEMVRELLREGAQLNYQPPSTTWPRQDPYDIAVETGQADLFLATVFAEQSQLMMNGLIEKATRQPSLDLYQKLLEHGLDLQDKETATEAVKHAFSYVSTSGEVIDFLLANNINKSALVKNLNSTTLNNGRIMKQILDYGIDINEHNSMGKTALTAVIEMTNAKPEILTMFLNYGADPNVNDSKGMPTLIALVQRISILRYYRLNNFVKFMQILLDHGANPTYVYQEKTALDILQKNIDYYKNSKSTNNNSKTTEHNVKTLRQMIDLLVANGA